MTEHAERAHPKYSGSKITRLRRCNAFARMAKAVGRRWGESEHAVEGTLRHELLEIALGDGEEAARADSRMTEERWNAIEGTVLYITKLRSEYPDLQVWTEYPVQFPQNVVHPGDCGGTADVVAYSAAARRGWLLDFKNGVVEVPDPEENDQLWFYATAVFWNVAVETITLVIAQPNGIGTEPIREHTISAVALIDFQSDINALLLRCEAPDAALTPGTWCTACDVGSECGAREREAIGALTGSPGTHQSLLIDELSKPEDLDVERWAAIRRKAAFVRSWLNAIDDASYAYAIGGGRVPSFKLVEAAARRRWLGKPEETAAGLAALTGRPAQDFLSVEVVGITAAEKELALAKKKSPDPKGLAAKFSLLTDKTSSGSLSLVPVEDPKPEYNPSAKAFMGVVPAELIEG